MRHHLQLRTILTLSFLVSVVWAGRTGTAMAGSTVTVFRDVSPEELKMTSEPAAPGAPAIILYEDLYRDDSGNTTLEESYFRIKILTEEGRKMADIEIPYSKDMANVKGIHARTIRPDGTIANFNGTIFIKSVVKARGVQDQAKTFTLPDVQVGSILEYFYTIDYNWDYYLNEHWVVGEDLFVKAADYVLQPYPGRMRWTWENFPKGDPPAKQGHDGAVRMHLTNIQAFVTEDWMPPEAQVKGHVDFIYSYGLGKLQTDVKLFWSDLGKRWDIGVERFLGKPKNLERAVAEIVGPNDTPEVKLQKIYARVQQMRNTSYEIAKTEQEEKRSKDKESNDAEQAWRRGYADGSELTWLYLALVRAAGFDAYGVMVPDRTRYFFDPGMMRADRLNQNVVMVKLNGKNIYCDPGAAFTPFALLPWAETAVQGLQLDKTEPTWVSSLVPNPDQARTERRATLTLSDTGDLEGKLTVTYTGLEAARLRVEERNADAAERKKHLEDKIKQYASGTSEAGLTNQPEWKDSALPLVAEFNFKITGYAAQAGRHVLIPMGIFGAQEKHIFDHAERVHPIYVEYPYRETDDITIQLPAGWKVSSLPAAWKAAGKVVGYASTADEKNGKLHLSRTITLDFILLDRKYYPALRQYFQQIKNADDQQVVLDPPAVAAGAN